MTSERFPRNALVWLWSRVYFFLKIKPKQGNSVKKVHVINFPTHPHNQQLPDGRCVCFCVCRKIDHHCVRHGAHYAQKTLLFFNGRAPLRLFDFFFFSPSNRLMDAPFHLLFFFYFRFFFVSNRLTDARHGRAPLLRSSNDSKMLYIRCILHE